MKRQSAFILFPSAALLLAVASGCTGQLPNSFRFKQAEENFDSTQDVNTKLDMLWVIDNSASMDVSQKRLREGFRSFATKYMKPSWDIRVAVITTDTYLAHSSFSGYLGATFSGTTGYKSNYISKLSQTLYGNPVAGRTTDFVNPSWAPGLVTLTAGANYGKFPAGVTVNQNWPHLGPNWAKLVPGTHDGPVPNLCYEGNGYFFLGTGNCRIRDDQTGNTGVSHCVNPGPGEDSVTQCINTSMNNTVHSGKSIISTMPPAGVSANGAWTDNLVNDFIVNLSVGANGNGSERGLSSVTQFLSDNEASSSTTKFFRPNSLRMVVFVSDEEDQSVTTPFPVPSNFTPNAYYSGGCAPKTVDGYTYTIGSCPNPSKLIPVSDIKTKMDTFFKGLDATTENPDPSPNYLVVSIVALTGQTLQTLHAERNAADMATFGSSSVSCDRADRYIALGTQVGNGSLAMDIGSSDYTALLDSIGQAIVSKKSTFNLNRAPTGSEDLIFLIKHEDGSVTSVRPDQYTIEGKLVTITDYNLVLSFSATDQISISYQPKTAY
jgi:hypothetical protein